MKTSRDEHHRENLVRIAGRMASTLGTMKGAVMKVGQMISLHEGLLPPEVTEILGKLQKNAHSVSFEMMDKQLHRARLTDGTPPGEACSEKYDQALRDHWGQLLLEFMLRGLLEFKFFHADPNFSNFAFRKTGEIVVYDFG